MHLTILLGRMKITLDQDFVDWSKAIFFDICGEYPLHNEEYYATRCQIPCREARKLSRLPEHHFWIAVERSVVSYHSHQYSHRKLLVFSKDEMRMLKIASALLNRLRMFGIHSSMGSDNISSYCSRPGVLPICSSRDQDFADFIESILASGFM